MQLVVLMAAVELGQYVNGFKLIPLLLVLLIWARLLTWVDKDAPAAHLPRSEINLGLIGVGIAAFALFFYLPGFLIAFGTLVVLLAAEFGAYLAIRNKQVGLGDLSKQFNDWISGFGIKKKGSEVTVGEVTIIDRTGQPIDPPGPEDPEVPAYAAVQKLLTMPLQREADRVEVMPSDGATSVKFYVDGVSYSGGSMERGEGAAAISYLKRAAGLDLNDRRKPQRGAIRAATATRKRIELQLQTAGNAVGEYMRLIVDPKKRHILQLGDLGLTDEQIEIITESIRDNKGLVLVSAPKDQGLTTLLYGLLRGHDAFLTHLQTIERAPELDLEGITQNRLQPNASPADEFKLVEWVTSQEPDGVLMGELTEPKSAGALLKYLDGGKRVYIGMRATSTFEALAQWRKIVGDDRRAMKHLKFIINGRVLRKLCSACKLGYRPDPETLRKLNMDVEKIGQLYQARSEPMRDQKGRPIPCTFCHDLRFKGRMGVYETLVAGDEIKQVVIEGGSVNQLKQAFRKQRGRYLQEQALARVEQGLTSVQEVLRVLRGPERSE